MRASLTRDTLLLPLQRIIGVVERRQTMPVLAHVLVEVDNQGRVTLTGTDMEVEMIGSTTAESSDPGSCTLPARKLYDLLRALPADMRIDLKLEGERALLRAGRSRYTLVTLPTVDFPTLDNIEVIDRLRIGEAALKALIERTQFAMANQDVRYYLNGMLFDMHGEVLRCVTTDGHRLAMAQTALPGNGNQARRQLIVPRKGVLELAGLLEAGEGEVELEFARNHLRVHREGVRFTSKLIDGKFPDYETVIPIGADHHVVVDRNVLRETLQRAAILSNEKYRGVKLELAKGRMRIVAHNPEQEEAVEEIEVETAVDNLSVGFNVGYLLDALGSLRGERVTLRLRDAQSSCLVEGVPDENARHVIMPLRL